MMNKELKKPSPDLFQIVLFGKGYGESILIHIGNNKYIVVDSFIDNMSGNPVTIDYLNEIGENPSSIIGIICTHWDDDHVKGISKIIEKIEHKINVYIPMVQSNRDKENFVRYVCMNADSDDINSTSEYKKLFDFFRDGKIQINFTSSCMNICSSELSSVNKDWASIYALSPSQANILKFLKNVVPPEEKTPRSNLQISNNGVSIVAFISRISDGILLGGDLENTQNEWDDVINIFPSKDKCSVFKIPHHGSKNAYNKNVWGKIVEKPISIITRFNPKELPRQDAIDEIKANSSKVFILGESSKKKSVQKEGHSLKGTYDSLISDFVRIDTKLGIVSLAWNNNKWEIQKFGAVEEINLLEDSYSECLGYSE